MRNNFNYIDIFGRENGLMVYPSKDAGYVRTKDNLSK